MSDKSSNGTTVSKDAVALAGVTNVTVNVNGAEIDISALAGSRKEYLDGLDDPEITINFVGAAHGGLAKGASGDFSVAWNDGTADTLNDMIVLRTSRQGGIDQPLTSSLTIKATAAAA